MEKTYKTLIFLFTLFFLFPLGSVFASETSGTIDAAYKYTRVCHDATCASYGTINFLPSNIAAISITDTGIIGNAWGDELGWINFAPLGGGVTVNPTTGAVSGSAWTQTSGWMNFRPSNSGAISFGIPIGVSINTNGELYGWAWSGGTYGGWVKFDCAQVSSCVKTDWRPISSRTPSASSGSSSGGSVPVAFLAQPVAQAVSTPVLNNPDTETPPMNNENSINSPKSPVFVAHKNSPSNSLRDTVPDIFSQSSLTETPEISKVDNSLLVTLVFSDFNFFEMGTQDSEVIPKSDEVSFGEKNEIRIFVKTEKVPLLTALLVLEISDASGGKPSFYPLAKNKQGTGYETTLPPLSSGNYKAAIKAYDQYHQVLAEVHGTIAVKKMIPPDFLNSFFSKKNTFGLVKIFVPTFFFIGIGVYFYRRRLG